VTKINRREALKAGAAGLALLASPFAIAQGSVSSNDAQKYKLLESRSPLADYKDLPPPIKRGILWTWPLAFWVEIYRERPDQADAKIVQIDKETIRTHWDTFSMAPYKTSPYKNSPYDISFNSEKRVCVDRLSGSMIIASSGGFKASVTVLTSDEVMLRARQIQYLNVLLIETTGEWNLAKGWRND